MTSKERLLIALKGGIADHVPVSPDISVMVPDRLDGRPFYEIHLDGREHYGWTSATHGEVYVKAVKYFDMDGFYMYGGLKETKVSSSLDFESETVDVPAGKLVRRTWHTAKGDVTEEEIFFADEAPWRSVKPIKNLQEDFEKFQLVMGKGDWQWEKEFRDKQVIGDLGVYLGMIPVFQDWWFSNRDGGFENVFSDLLMEADYMQKVHEFWMNWALAYLRAMIEAKPDVIMLGGSSASLSVSSPDIFRKYELPFIQQASSICKAANMPCHLHICGRSWPLVQIVAEETDVTSMEPMEEPPTGNVDIAMVKKRY
ncbi:MAG TPA: uroporphyrinogen decarboxylase family protein, partial [Candidatus Marinimicrobia bacterium]|nr:uroporphyrinogen decarboxylase family protein [Candidatus Neomarinimicrobiota bacterium]HRU93562.1 uroporphyrinogen decarboxylase family protein [Candidatus Neomarinimicrobiota bacterium]